MSQEKVYMKSLPVWVDQFEESVPVTVIDGDGFAYIVGWHFSGQYEVTEETLTAVHDKLDNFISSTIKATGGKFYIGLLEAEVDYTTPTSQYVPPKNFRANYAVSKVYKGKRPDKPEWYKIWGPYIQKRLIDKWNFQRVPPNVEADDVAVSLIKKLKTEPKVVTVLAGNDKDLHQCEGVYYNYKKNESVYITDLEATKFLYTQVLMGDSVDNIQGLPGCGKGTAEKIMNNPSVNEKSAYMYTLKEFVHKLGEYHGIRAFIESYMLCKLVEDINVSNYYLTEFIEKEEEMLTHMRELLGDTEVKEILTEQKIDPMDFSKSNLFKL